MDIATIAQIVSAVTNLFFVVVLAGGYYFTWRVSQKTLAKMKSQRTAMGRPLVIVQEDYDGLPEIDIGIRNISQTTARDITFEFSHKVESANEFVISELPYFKYGLDFLPPHGEINCYWGEINLLLPLLEKRGLEGGIFVTVRYKDLAGKSYESQWKLNLFLYKDTRIVNRWGMRNLVAAVERIAVSEEERMRREAEAQTDTGPAG